MFQPGTYHRKKNTKDSAKRYHFKDHLKQTAFNNCSLNKTATSKFNLSGNNIFGSLRDGNICFQSPLEVYNFSSVQTQTFSDQSQLNYDY